VGGETGACAARALRREDCVTTLDTLEVDLTVVLGKTRLPLQRLLRMGRGAVIGLNKSDTDLVDIFANDHPIARGQISVRGATIMIEITELVRKVEIERTPGTTIGGHFRADLLQAGLGPDEASLPES
jgi:flagellar motor switch protein FliN/FliY